MLVFLFLVSFLLTLGSSNARDLSTVLKARPTTIFTTTTGRTSVLVGGTTTPILKYSFAPCRDDPNPRHCCVIWPHSFGCCFDFEVAVHQKCCDAHPEWAGCENTGEAGTSGTTAMATGTEMATGPGGKKESESESTAPTSRTPPVEPSTTSAEGENDCGNNENWVAWEGHSYCAEPGDPYCSEYTPEFGRARCRQMGAELASIHSRAENEFVIGLLKATINDPNRCSACDSLCKNSNKPSAAFWIGLKLLNRSATAFGQQFVDASWSDASPVDYGGDLANAEGREPWYRGALRQSGGKCTQIFGLLHIRSHDKWGWMDVKCDGMKYVGYLCKKKN